jgi:hypothetical protein
MTLMTAIAINLALGGPVFYGLIKLLSHGILADVTAASSAQRAPSAVDAERLAA